MVKVKKVLEGYTQGEVGAWARHDLGLLACKLSTIAQRSFPDFCFFIPGGRPLLIEFKATGKEATKAQADIHEQLRAKGYDVETHDSIEGAKFCILRHCATAWFQRGVGDPEILKHEYRRLGFTWSEVDGIAFGNVRGATKVGNGALYGGGAEVAGEAPPRRRVAGPGDAENVRGARGVLRRPKGA